MDLTNNLDRRRFLELVAMTVAGVGLAGEQFSFASGGAERKPSRKGRTRALPAVRSVECRNGRLVVNGKPFLPVGIYHAAHWHKGLKEAGEQGFNLVQTYGGKPEDFRTDIEEAYSNGMYSAVALNGLCERTEVIETIVKDCRKAPGLLLWMLEDEPNIRLPGPEDKPYPERPFRLPPEKLQPAYDLIKRLDPTHPVWLNLAHGFLKDHQAYNGVADVKSDDIYPVPEAPLAAVAAYAKAVAGGAAGKPAWLVLQMAPVRPQLGSRDRHPTMTEVRCMTYMALSHGITGVGYYSFNERPGYDWRINESDPAYWEEWAELTAELYSLAPHLLAPEAPGPITVEILEGDDKPGPWGFPALHLSLRRIPAGRFLIAVNGFPTPVKARLRLPVDPKVVRATVKYENRTVSLQGSVLQDSFAPYAVHLYELGGPT